MGEEKKKRDVQPNLELCYVEIQLIWDSSLFSCFEDSSSREKSVSRRYCVIQTLKRMFVVQHGFILVLCIKIVIAFSFSLLFLIIAISVSPGKRKWRSFRRNLYTKKHEKRICWISIVFVICSYSLSCISTFCFISINVQSTTRLHFSLLCVLFFIHYFASLEFSLL